MRSAKNNVIEQYEVWYVKRETYGYIFLSRSYETNNANIMQTFHRSFRAWTFQKWRCTDTELTRSESPPSISCPKRSGHSKIATSPSSFFPATVITAAKLGEHSYTRYDRQPSSIGGGVQAVWRDNCNNHGHTQKDLQWRVSIHALLLPTSATSTAELPTMQPLTSTDVGTCVEARDLGANRTRFPPLEIMDVLMCLGFPFCWTFQHLAKARQKRH